MPLRFKGSLDGKGEPVITTYPIVAGTAVKREYCAKWSPAANSVAAMADADYTNGTTVVVGVLQQDSASTDTFVIIPAAINPLNIYEVKVKEVIDEVVLTADGGSATTFIDVSLRGVADGELVGSTIEVVTIASGNVPAGTQIEVTAYTNTSGTLTFASVGATGFAAGDTIKIVKLGTGIIGSKTVRLDATNLDHIKLDQLNYGNWCSVVGVNDEKDGVRIALRNITPLR